MESAESSRSGRSESVQQLTLERAHSNNKILGGTKHKPNTSQSEEDEDDQSEDEESDQLEEDESDQSEQEESQSVSGSDMPKDEEGSDKSDDNEFTTGTCLFAGSGVMLIFHQQRPCCIWLRIFTDRRIPFL